jgi:SGNH domain (fused to AT3 domains)
VLVTALILGSIGIMAARHDRARGGGSPVISSHPSPPSTTAPAPTEVPASPEVTPSPTPVVATPVSIPKVVAAVAAARRGSPIPARLVPPLPQIKYDQYPRIPNCWDLRHEPGHLGRCSLFTSGRRGTIVLIGDSHARSWLTPISWMARRDGWTVVPLWHVGCWPASYHAGRTCTTFERWAGREVRALRPDVVLIGGNFPYGNRHSIPKTTEGITEFVSRIKADARHVVLIGDPPSLRFDPTDCLGAPGATLRTCTATLTAQQVAAYRTAKETAGRVGAAFLDTMGWFCFNRRCPAVVGHTVTYRVKDHITRSYGATLGPLFRAAFRRAISASPEE